MPGELVAAYQFNLRHRGVDSMSSTGGVLSSAHTEQYVDEAKAAFEETVKALREAELVCGL